MTACMCGHVLLSNTIFGDVVFVFVFVLVSSLTIQYTAVLSLPASFFLFVFASKNYYRMIYVRTIYSTTVAS